MTTTPAGLIRLAGPADTATVAAVLAAGLSETAIAHWLVPDHTTRPRVYRDYFTLVTPWFIDHGTVHLFGDGAGAAMWATTTGPFTPDIDDYDTRLAAACGPATPRFIELDQAMLVHHPTTPHEYLAYIGVNPDSQGRGIGTALLTHHTTTLDHHATPAYLEATGPRNAALYHRLGFTPLNPYPAGHRAPPLHPMWRQSATHRHTTRIRS